MYFFITVLLNQKKWVQSEDAIIVAVFEINMLLRVDTVRNAGTTTTYVGWMSRGKE